MCFAHFSLFGKLQIQIKGEAAIGCEARRLQELLCYLLLYRDRFHPRETLATVFWGDYSTTHSKKYLRQALWQLQSVLDSATAQAHASLLAVDTEWVRLNLHADYWLDVACFEAAFADVQSIPGYKLTAAQVQSLQSAAYLYQGNLLEGWQHDWCIFERERLQSMYLTMLDKLISYSDAQHDFEGGLLYGAQVLRYDRARENTHRRLMRLYYLTGDRTGALRQYQSCVAALRKELDVAPAASTQHLYQQICADQRAAVESFPLENQPHKAAVTDQKTLTAIDQLKTLQSTLAFLNHQVSDCIHTFEQTLYL